jgi:formylglycine-generating enzyme required for sulfatase activity
MPFVLIPSGTFAMGSPRGEEGRFDDERLHDVTLSRPYYLGVWPVTNAQYRRWRPDHTSGDPRLDGPDQPVVHVRWDDAVGFADWLRGQHPDHGYRLPTEAEWEHACRAGRASPCDDVGGAGVRGELAALRLQPSGVPPAVQRGAASPWGLCGMLGTVWTWCSDWFGDYPHGATTDPRGPATGRERSDEFGVDERVVRGGSYLSVRLGAFEELRCAYRGRLEPGARDPDLGLRLAFDAVADLRGRATREVAASAPGSPMRDAEAAVLAEMIRRLRLTREDPERLQELARWSDEVVLADEFVGSDVRVLAVEIACAWENLLSAAHESGHAESFMHLKFDEGSLADWRARAVALARAG